MVTNIYKHKSALQKLAVSAACALALGTASVAHAGVLNFESGFEDPILTSHQYQQSGQFWVETRGYGALSGDMVGVVVDGADNGLCVSGGCPTNNGSHYYAGLNDGYLYFGLNNPSQRFQLQSLQASWIGAEGVNYPATPGAIRILGYNDQNALLSDNVVWMPGPSNGQFKFNTIDLSPLSANRYSYVLILGYGCSTPSSCVANGGLSNFALDNIQVAEIPEPAGFALFGLGLAGMAALRRRRSI